jgi:hypothetical protein
VAHHSRRRAHARRHHARWRHHARRRHSSAVPLGHASCKHTRASATGMKAWRASRYEAAGDSGVRCETTSYSRHSCGVQRGAQHASRCERQRGTHNRCDRTIGAVICTSMFRGQAIVTQHQLMPSAATPPPHPHNQPARTHRHTRTRSCTHASTHTVNRHLPVTRGEGGRGGPQVHCNELRTACCNVAPQYRGVAALTGHVHPPGTRRHRHHRRTLRIAKET